MAREVQFVRLPISLPCPVPVIPGTPDVLDSDGQPIDIAERTETCNVDAWWAMGAQVSCDVHMRIACGLIGVDYEDLLAESGGPFPSERKPWVERKRYPQAGG